MSSTDEQTQQQKQEQMTEQEQDTADRDIFAIVGVSPEVLAVSMAKYSRSTASIRDSLVSLSDSKAEAFHEKWVLGYGDASVADMATISIACENVSILASKAIEDNRIASYQEKSTRYVPFFKHYEPPVLMESAHAELYTETIAYLMDTYAKLVDVMIEYYGKAYPKPEPDAEGKQMSDKLYQNRLRARALDVARYVLPTATITNLGLVMNARSLRHCISKLKASPTQEISRIGEEIQNAALSPAFNPQSDKVNALLEDMAQEDTLNDASRDMLERIGEAVNYQVKGAPTLVKRTDPKEYLVKQKEVLTQLAAKHLGHLSTPDGDATPRVSFHPSSDGLSLRDEAVATMLYSASGHSYADIVAVVQEMSEEDKQGVYEAVQGNRSRWDWPSREFECGQALVFDTAMDYGAYRDLQRHRMCTQINQPLGVSLGWEVPRDLEEAGGLELYTSAMERSREAFETIAADFPHEAAYVSCMAMRKRTLFKMNLREFYHIVELRTKSGGHFSYRTAVYDMWNLFAQENPQIAEDIRVVKMDFDGDFFGR